MNRAAQTIERPTAETPRHQVSWATPRANIHEVKDAYILELEMPGVRKEGLEITVDNNELAIVGRRWEETLKAEVVHRELQPLDFRRVFDLDPSIDATKITARIEQGIVTVTLPKAESLKPLKIKVSD